VVIMQNEQKAERAKQFLPFDSLKGFRDCLKQKERVIVARKQLSQDDCEVLNQNLNRIALGDMVRVVYYDIDNYIEVHGMVSKIDIEYQKYIQVVDQRIALKDIIELTI